MPAWSALNRHDAEKALQVLKPGAPYDAITFTPVLFTRATVYLAAEKGDEALQEFQKIRDLRNLYPDDPLMSLAGHVSQRMLSHYSHIRLQAKRNALDRLSTRQASADRGGEAKSYVTKHVTNMALGPERDLEVIEDMVELVGIEPTTSSLRTIRSPS